MNAELDDYREFGAIYNYQLIENSAQKYNYFQISAPSLNNDIHLGFARHGDYYYGNITDILGES